MSPERTNSGVIVCFKPAAVPEANNSPGFRSFQIHRRSRIVRIPGILYFSKAAVFPSSTIHRLFVDNDNITVPIVHTCAPFCALRRQLSSAQEPRSQSVGWSCSYPRPGRGRPQHRASRSPRTGRELPARTLASGTRPGDNCLGLMAPPPRDQQAWRLRCARVRGARLKGSPPRAAVAGGGGGRCARDGVKVLCTLRGGSYLPSGPGPKALARPRITPRQRRFQRKGTDIH